MLYCSQLLSVFMSILHDTAGVCNLFVMQCGLHVLYVDCYTNKCIIIIYYFNLIQSTDQVLYGSMWLEYSTTRSFTIKSPFFPHLGTYRGVCEFLCQKTPLSSTLGCLPPFTVAGKQLPSLFTLLFFSVYSVLQRSGTPRSKQLFHYGERRRFDCAVPPHGSLRQPTIVTVMTPVLHCCHKVQSPSMPEWLLGNCQRHKTNLPSSALD